MTGSTYFTMTKEQATEKAIDWSNMHSEAETEEECGCFGAAEELRIKAADLETELRDAGFDACRLSEEAKRRR